MGGHTESHYKLGGLELHINDAITSQRPDPQNCELIIAEVTKAVADINEMITHAHATVSTIMNAKTVEKLHAAQTEAQPKIKAAEAEFKGQIHLHCANIEHFNSANTHFVNKMAGILADAEGKMMHIRKEVEEICIDCISCPFIDYDKTIMKALRKLYPDQPNRFIPEFLNHAGLNSRAQEVVHSYSLHSQKLETRVAHNKILSSAISSVLQKSQQTVVIAMNTLSDTSRPELFETSYRETISTIKEASKDHLSNLNLVSRSIFS